MFTLNEIVRITKGSLVQGNGLAKVRRVSIDSRRIRAGDLFVAVKGARYDGHAFIAAAFRRGAVAALVSSSFQKSVNQSRGLIAVEDPVRALGLMAREYRRRFSLPVVAITGSTGKTTTKEMIACVLKKDFRVLKNPGTENNQFGVPLTLFRIQPRYQLLVLELGTNRPGDIAWLAMVSEPDVAVFTNIGESHLERLGSPRRVYNEKKTLISATRPDGTIIVNNDDRFLRGIPHQPTKQRCITYAIERPACFQAQAIRPLEHQGWSFNVNDRHPFVVKTSAQHNIYNALAAVACARLFHVDFATIASRLARSGSMRGRQTVRRKGGVIIIDDTYNANPVSFVSALTTLANSECHGRRVLVCADMLELGRQSRQLHIRCGIHAARSGLDAIFGYGPQVRHLIQAAHKERPQITASHFRLRRDLHAGILRYCRRGDVCLVKGSRAMAMDQTVAFLQDKFSSNKG